MSTHLSNHVPRSAVQTDLPQETMPLTSDIINSNWQPTNAVDPDFNARLLQHSTHRLAQSCIYYSDQESNLAVNNFNSTAFSLLHFNVRGITSNHRYSELESFLKPKSLKVVGLCETFLTSSNNALYNFTGYHVIHKSRSNGRERGGGLALLIKQSISFCERPDLSQHLNHAESLFIELPRSSFGFNKKIIVGEIYRPPNSNKQAFIEEIENILSILNRNDCICYLMGDFNIDLMNCDSDPVALNFLNSFHHQSFFPLINRPTRLMSRTLIDHIFTNSLFCLSGGHFSSGIILHDLSDHCPIFHIADSFQAVHDEPRQEITFQLINDHTISALKSKLGALNWNEVLTLNDPDQCYNHFLEMLSAAYFDCIPVIKKKLKPNCKPWLTAALITSVKEKNRLYAQSIKYPCTYTREKYRVYKNRLTHMLRISERNYAREQLLHYNHSLKHQWKVINSLIERGNHSSLPTSMRMSTDSEPVTDSESIANEMNLFFVNSGASVIANNQTSQTDPLSFVPDLSNEHSMNSYLATTDEILNIIGNLKDSAAGPDRLKPKVIKLVKHELVVPIKHVVNTSLKKGIFPDKLKEALITPIYKKGAKDLVNNYRPISVLNVFSKVIERVMHKRLVSYCEAANIFFDRQFGFRSGHSTEMAVTEAVSIITKALNEKVPILAVNMDLSKAFDTIDHAILCSKLGKYGISRNILSWFQSYLRGRSQQVQFNNSISSPQTITRGVPQGSILGPLLFILYVNDLHFSCSESEMIIYADDCNVFFRINPSDPDFATQTNASLANISKWFSCNQLALNVSKTNYMVFSGRRRLKIENISMNNSPLEQVSQTNFLGICIDDALSWKPHIQVTCRKLARSIGILRKVNKHLNRSITLQLYNSFVIPYLQYGITVWGAAYQTSMEPLFVLQKKALKIALNLPIRTRTEILFAETKILPLRKIYEFSVATFMFKFNNSLLPNCFKHYFARNTQTHNYQTRSANLFRLPLFTTVNAQQSILFQGPKIWHQLPVPLTQCSSLRNFKWKLRRCLSGQLNL